MAQSGGLIDDAPVGVLAALTLGAGILAGATAFPLIVSGRLPCMQLRGYAITDVRERFEAYGRRGRNRYQAYLAVDSLVFVPLYTVLLARLIRAAAPELDANAPRIVAVLPMLAGVADWLEDLLLLAAVRDRRLIDSVVPLANRATQAKFGFIVLSLAVVLWGLKPPAVSRT